MKNWTLYILDCDGRRLYTGITTDIARRLKEHSAGRSKGAKAIRGARRIRPVFTVAVGPRDLAARLEIAIKRLTRNEKLAIVGLQPSLAELTGRLLGPGADGGKTPGPAGCR